MGTRSDSKVIACAVPLNVGASVLARALRPSSRMRDLRDPAQARMPAPIPSFFTTCYNSLSGALSLRLYPAAELEGWLRKSRTSFCLLAMCVGLGASPISAQSGVAVQKVQIADGIYQFITAPDGYVPNGNSVVIVNDRDVGGFDTLLGLPPHAAYFLRFGRSRTSRYVTSSIRITTPTIGPAMRFMSRHFPISKSLPASNRASSC
jgi:hypothetical protein